MTAQPTPRRPRVSLQIHKFFFFLPAVSETNGLAKLSYFTNLDFPEIRGPIFPYFSPLFGGPGRSCWSFFCAEGQLHDGEITQAHALDVEPRLSLFRGEKSSVFGRIGCFDQKGGLWKASWNSDERHVDQNLSGDYCQRVLQLGNPLFFKIVTNESV